MSRRQHFLAHRAQGCTNRSDRPKPDAVPLDSLDDKQFMIEVQERNGDAFRVLFGRLERTNLLSSAQNPTASLADDFLVPVSVLPRANKEIIEKRREKAHWE
jgi:hypothetical protein